MPFRCPYPAAQHSETIGRQRRSGPGGVLAVGPVRWILILIFVLRSGIDLYCGWGGVSVVSWMIGAVLLYRAVRSVWPLVIGPIIYDILTGILQSTTTPVSYTHLRAHETDSYLVC